MNTPRNDPADFLLSAFWPSAHEDKNR